MSELPKLHDCSDCDRKFGTIRGLASHRQMKHSPAAKHQQIITEINQKIAAMPIELRLPYECDDCGKRFLTAHQLTSHRRQVHGISAPLKTIISSSVMAFAERHGWRCYWCNGHVRWDVNNSHDEGPSREHLVPASRGGGRTADNLVLAHKRCNHRRGVIHPEAFRRLMAGEAVTADEMWPDERFNEIRVVGS